ncbi:hypothetical protein JW905_15345 [bacterium]|nr:hypothetical protein [candidate division CSSED10-310 bacterium]
MKRVLGMSLTACIHTAFWRSVWFIMVLAASLTGAAGVEAVPPGLEATGAIGAWQKAELTWCGQQERWLAADQVREPLRRDELYRSGGRGAMVAVVVEETLWPVVATGVEEYLADLRAAGWEVLLTTAGGGSPEELREYLHGVLGEGLAGVYLIGPLPEAWYRTDDGEPFPFDAFYMDLDGVWEDADGDGEYDGHSGAADYDVFVGRTNASLLSGVPTAELVNEYLARVHAYRSGVLTSADTGLVYIDNDFVGDAHNWEADLERLCGHVTTVTDPATTSGDDYRGRLREGYRWMQPFVHSSHDAHYFAAPGSDNVVYSTELPAIMPAAQFYLAYACSSGRFTAPDCMTTWYSLAPTHGVAAIGSAKTGSMFMFRDFFSELAGGKCLGEAFRTWADAWMDRNPGWFMGLNIQGDPCLQPLQEPAVIQATAADLEPGMLLAGADNEVAVEVAHFGWTTLDGLSLRLESEDHYLVVAAGEAACGIVAPGERVTMEGVLLRLASACPDGREVRAHAWLTADSGEVWEDDLVFTAVASKPEIEAAYWDAYRVIEAGQSGRAWLLIRNRGGADMASGLAALSGDDLLVAYPPAVSLPIIARGAEATIPIDGIAIHPEHPDLGYTRFALTLSDSGHTVAFHLPVGAGTGWSAAFDGAPWLAVEAVTEGCYTEWHHGSLDGVPVLHCGNMDPALPYSSGSDGTAVTPEFFLAPDSMAGIRHRTEIEPHWDGGIVELNQGNGWELLEPVTGYPSSLMWGNMMAVAGTPCFSGSQPWRVDLFDLSGREGPARLRFHFGSDGGATDAGWWLSHVWVSDPKHPLPPQARIDTNLRDYEPGDRFTITLNVRTFAEATDVACCIILEMHEATRPRYFYYPEWSGDFRATSLRLEPWLWSDAVLIDATLPSVLPEAEFTAWAALLEPATGRLLAAPSQAGFRCGAAK